MTMSSDINLEISDMMISISARVRLVGLLHPHSSSLAATGFLRKKHWDDHIGDIEVLRDGGWTRPGTWETCGASKGHFGVSSPSCHHPAHHPAHHPVISLWIFWFSAFNLLQRRLFCLLLLLLDPISFNGAEIFFLIFNKQTCLHFHQSLPMSLFHHRNISRRLVTLKKFHFLMFLPSREDTIVVVFCNLIQIYLVIWDKYIMQFETKIYCNFSPPGRTP